MEKGANAMIEYYKIDTQCMFDSLEDAEIFSVLIDQDEENDVASFQTNYLLVNYIEDALQFQYETTEEKLSVLSSYANKMQEYIIFSMLDFIKTGVLNFEDLKSADVEDQLTFNRLINLAGGSINDFSILQEVQRVIEICKSNQMFFNSKQGQCER